MRAVFATGSGRVTVVRIVSRVCHSEDVTFTERREAARRRCEGLQCRDSAIRPFVIGRKNWLFSDTPKGATASAQIYSLIETVKANGQEPYAWLRHILERLPAASSVADYEALLPWNCSTTSAPAP